jgi:hypothetical protein
MEVLVMSYQERQRKAVCEMIKQRRITIVKGQNNVNYVIVRC